MTPEYVRKILDYDPRTGEFVWKIDSANNVKKGSVAGAYMNGYMRITINGETHRSHRLAWFYVHGKWPDGHLDHINRIRNDNRICNLREASRQLNSFNSSVHKNNKVGIKGVSKTPWNKYHAIIRYSGKNHFLGSFTTKEEAGSAYKKAYKEITGDEYWE